MLLTGNREMALDGDWLHKVGENIVTAVTSLASGVLLTLLTRASKGEVVALQLRLREIESRQGAQEVAFATVNAKLDGLHDDMRGIRRLLERRKETDE